MRDPKDPRRIAAVVTPISAAKNFKRSKLFADMRASDVRFIGPEWLEYGRIPSTGITITEGEGGVGKTTGNMGILARASIGQCFFDSFLKREPINSVIVASEDDHGMLRKKLEIAGADCDRIFFTTARLFPITPAAEGDFESEAISLPRDLPALREYVAEREARIVYFDKIFGHVDLGESNMSHKVGKIVTALALASREMKVALLLNRHWTKGTGKDRGQGVKDWTDGARSVLAFARHPDGASTEGWDRGVIALGKTNGVLTGDVPTIGYKIEPLAVTDDDGKTHDRDGRPFTVTRLTLEGPVEGVTADDLATATPENSDNKILSASCIETIRELLTNGPQPLIEIQKTLTKQGYSRAMIFRCKSKAGVRSITSATFPRTAQWEIRR